MANNDYSNMLFFCQAHKAVCGKGYLAYPAYHPVHLLGIYGLNGINYRYIRFFRSQCSHNSFQPCFRQNA